MILSVWRYAHLALALCCSIFLVLAAISGAILAGNTISEKATFQPQYDLERITLATSLPVLKKVYPEIVNLSVDANRHVVLQGTDQKGEAVNAYIDPRNGSIIGAAKPQTETIKWVTSFHRSLFLHEGGRLFIGINSFLFILITLSGLLLLIQRQGGIKHTFSSIGKTDSFRYYHVLTGRWALIPLLIIALTGTYLSMARFGLIPEQKISHKISDKMDLTESDTNDPATFTLFKKIPLSTVQNIEFPFSDDPEEYFTLKLKNREIVADQISGKVVSEIPYTNFTLLTNLSLDLHTGNAHLLWAIILFLSCLNILYFIYSGFRVTLKRREGRFKNKYKAENATYILLVGSENGSTMRFASAIHRQLLASKEKAYLTEMNNYQHFPLAAHLIVFTSTHGLGDAPANAKKLPELLKTYSQPSGLQFSVVGFGSKTYPDFCGYARKIDELLEAEPWSKRILPIHEVEDQSLIDFTTWAGNWNIKTGTALATSPAFYAHKPTNLVSLRIVEHSTMDSNQTFSLRLKPEKRIRFTSGDLLAIYPAADGPERLYSMARIGDDIQLVVKFHEGGMGSTYLYKLKPGDAIRARIIRNEAFHLPERAGSVAMIANGTGIAPFMGMVAQNKKKRNLYLYSGFRRNTEIVRQHQQQLTKHINDGHLKKFSPAFSQEQYAAYVMDLIEQDSVFFAQLLEDGGTIMICGSVAMQLNVEEKLHHICMNHGSKSFDTYKDQGQVVADCY